MATLDCKELDLNQSVIHPKDSPPGLTPQSPVSIVRPVLVTVAAARAPKLPAVISTAHKDGNGGGQMVMGHSSADYEILCTDTTATHIAVTWSVDTN